MMSDVSTLSASVDRMLFLNSATADPSGSNDPMRPLTPQGLEEATRRKAEATINPAFFLVSAPTFCAVNTIMAIIGHDEPYTLRIVPELYPANGRFQQVFKQIGDACLQKYFDAGHQQLLAKTADTALTAVWQAVNREAGDTSTLVICGNSVLNLAMAWRVATKRGLPMARLVVWSGGNGRAICVERPHIDFFGL